MKKASAQGAVVKNGLEMLHLQAEASWHFWHSTDD
jgi:shikimate dehydrogenase